MKVKDLIKLLSEFDGELELRGSYNGGEYESDFELMNLEKREGEVWLLD
jgi:hypothetical protein